MRIGRSRKLAKALPKKKHGSNVAMRYEPAAIGTEAGMAYTPGLMLSGLPSIRVAMTGTVEIGPLPVYPEEVVFNYQRTYWEVAEALYETIEEIGPRLDLLDVIATNLCMGLVKLFGMHWTPEVKQKYNNERDRLLTDRFQARSPTDRELKDFTKEYPETKKGGTFTLYTMVRVGYVLGKSWDLRDDDNELYCRFRKLNAYYTDISKHFERKKVDKAVAAVQKDIQEYMDTTKAVFRWFMAKFYGEIPAHAKKHYHDIFREDFIP